jgi:hypothetical protein
MRRVARLATVAITAALAVAVALPAVAKPPKPPKAPKHKMPKAPKSPKSHKCSAHEDAYTVSGSFESWSVSPGAKPGTYTGTITIDVTKGNHHAKGQTGPQTYTLDNTKVKLRKRANPPTAGDRVKLIGKITTIAKKCTDQSGAGTITVKKVDIKPPKHPGKHDR